MRTFAQKQKPTQEVKLANSIRSGRAFSGQSREAGSILHLQRPIGNQTVQRLLQDKTEDLEASSVSSTSTEFGHDFSRIPVYPSARSNIQPTLKINVPGDVYEQEADRVADQVIAMREQETEQPEQLQSQEEEETRSKSLASSIRPLVQRQETPEEKKGEEERDDHKTTVQTKSLHREDIGNRLKRSKGGGTPIANEVRAFLEPRMQFDFSKVRIHQDNEAAQMNQDLGARAFTHGRDIYFGAGQYTPNSREGRQLLIHELTHVVQQGRVQGSPTLVQRESIEEYAREVAKQRRFLREAALELAKGSTKTERVLKFVGTWGRNASPFNIAMNYVRLNWQGVSYWMEVRKAAKAGRALLKHVESLERGARALKKASDELYSFQYELPGYPLKTAEEAGQMTVTDAELEYVEKYYNTAAAIANDAWRLSSELRKAIEGWDAVVTQANNTKDFTRAAVWDAINTLNLRFNNEGGDFRAYLVNARDRANAVQYWAENKQYHAADILGKWTPIGYQPPEGPF
jgi:hypothetical protein